MNHPIESNGNHRLIEQLAERLDAAERSLASAHVEIARLQRGSRQSWRARCATVAVGVIAVFITVMLGRAGVTYAQGSGQRVSAPFEVVSSTGHTLFKVNDWDDQNQACLYNNISSKPVSCLMATQYGGHFAAAGNDTKLTTALGTDMNGNGSLIIWDASKQPIADILVGPRGGRGLAVYDSSGNQKVLVSTTTQALGQVLVQTEDRTAAVGLVAGKTGIEGSRGAFVYDDSENPVSEMIVNSEGVGAVRALQSGGGGSAVLFAEQGIGGVLRVRGQKGEIVGEVTEHGFGYFGSSGNPKFLSSLTEWGGRGVVAVYSAEGTPLAFLTESDKSGGGNVTIADPSGSGVFSAGYVGGGANSCIDLPKHGLKCEGIGLPMTISVQK